MQQQGDKEKDAEGRRKREKSAKKKAKKQTVVNDEEKQVGQTPNGRVLSGAGVDCRRSTAQSGRGGGARVT